MGQQRGLKLVNLMSQRVQAESKNADRPQRICYLMISSREQVDETANVFRFLEKEYTTPYRYIPKDYFNK